MDRGRAGRRAGTTPGPICGSAPLLALAYATAFAAERIAPFFDEWNDHDAHGDTPTNFLHILVYEMQSINGVLLIPLIVWLFPFQGLWPTEWPLWAQLLVAFVISDFTFMMMHYLSHRYAPLWRLHAVHHGVGRLYGMNGVMRHPLHQVIDMIIGSAPLVIMGMPVPVAVLLGFLISVTLIVQHSNVDARLGPLQGHLSIGRIHHLHHVNWGTEGDCNFGLLLTLWDKLLGTYQDKPPREITAAGHGRRRAAELPQELRRAVPAAAPLQARRRRARALSQAGRRRRRRRPRRKPAASSTPPSSSRSTA